MTDTPVSLHLALSRLHDHPLIIAHRGDWRVLPENSVAAMLAARDIGADMVEIDAQAIADGTLVVIHDDRLDRTTCTTGAVADLHSTDLPGLFLRAADGGAAALTPHPLPLLEDMLTALRGKVLINIDTKHARDLDAVAALVLRMGMQDQVLLKSAVTDPAPILASAWFGRVPFMPLCMDLPKGALSARAAAVAHATRALMIEINFYDLAEVAALDAELAPAGTGIWVNTLDPVHSQDFCDSRATQDPGAVWGALLSSGIRAIQTDRAAELAAYLGRINLQSLD